MNQTAAETVILADVLRYALPLKTRLAGSQVTDLIVNWVVVVTEYEGLERQVQAGDIVILPGSVQDQATDRELLATLKQVSGLSAAALLLFRPIANDLSQAAEASDLPILIIPADASLRDVHQDIAGLLVDRQKQITERGMQLYRRLTEMSREDLGLSPTPSGRP